MLLLLHIMINLDEKYLPYLKILCKILYSSLYEMVSELHRVGGNLRLEI